MLKYCLAAVGALLATQASTAAAQSIQVANPAAYVGSWQGRVADLAGGGASGYQAEVTIALDTRGQLFGSIWYHTYECGGSWTPVSAGADGVRMLESIVFVGRGCPPRAYVKLSPLPDGGLAMWWSGGPDAAPTSSGQLARR